MIKRLRIIHDVNIITREKIVIKYRRLKPCNCSQKF